MKVKELYHIAIITPVILIIFLMISGCSSRVKSPVVLEDSTLVYLPIDSNDILAKITLFRKRSQRNNKLLNKGTVFSLKKNRKVRALINLRNLKLQHESDAVFHIDWVYDNGSSFHKKQVTLSLPDTSSVIESYISISPEIRNPGDYTIKVYYFRELIAEKNFHLLPEVIEPKLVGDEITAQITLYRKKSKKTGKLIGKGTSFKIKKKRNIRAIIDIHNRFGYGNRELKFKIKWLNEQGEVFYRKRVNLPSTDSTSTIKSSISITPGKHIPGNYTIQVYLFNKKIGEQKFKIRL